MTEVPQASAAFSVSLSAFQTFLECEQKYFYGYVRKIRPKETHPAPTLGRILHSYLEHYYKSLRDGRNSEDAHLEAQLQTSNEYIEELKGLAQTYWSMGYEEQAKEIANLPRLAGRLSDRYWNVRGRDDAQRYEILFVETRLNLAIAKNIRSNGVADLITKDNDTGRVNLWEHKSTQSVPPDSVRLRDFQTMLYAVKVREQLDVIIDSILWNYIRTKEPTVPEVLKSGGITKRKDIDTTWPVYATALESIGIDPMSPEYAEMRERLLDREEVVYFPRYEQVIVTQENLLMSDYITVAERMRRARVDWARGERPIRTISRSCDFCQFRKLCHAALTGGDEEDVVRLAFVEG